MFKSGTGETLSVINARKFLDRIQSMCDASAERILRHRLFASLRQGKMRKETLRGWIIETYHLISARPRHAAAALAGCRHRAWQRILNASLTDSNDHSAYLARGLEALGIASDVLTRTHPLVGTLALIHLLEDIGRQSTLAYLACEMLREARGKYLQEILAMIRTHADRYELPPETLSPLFVDFLGGVSPLRQNLLARALEKESCIEPREAHRVVTCLQDMVLSFDQYHDQILKYYGKASDPFPRLVCNYPA